MSRSFLFLHLFINQVFEFNLNLTISCFVFLHLFFFFICCAKTNVKFEEKEMLKIEKFRKGGGEVKSSCLVMQGSVVMFVPTCI